MIRQLNRNKENISRFSNLLHVRVRPERLVGLDIGASEIKLVVLGKVRGRISLEAYCADTVEIEEVSNPGEPLLRLRRSLRSMVKRYHLQGEKAVAVFPNEDFTSKMVILPKMPARELKQAIVFEAKKFSSIPADDAFIDYIRINEFEQEGARYVSCLIVAAARQQVRNLTRLISDAGLKPIGFTIPLLALKSVVERVIDRNTEPMVALIDVGDKETSFSLLKDGALEFNREISASIGALRESLRTVVVSGDRTVDLDEAGTEKILDRYGVLDELSAEGETEDGIPLSRIAIMQRPVLEKMLIEIERSLDFCQEQFGIAAPDKLYICGPGTRLKNLRDYLGSRLHMEVDNLFPISAVDDATEEDSRRFGAMDLGEALGCALCLANGEDIFSACLADGTGRYVRPVLNGLAVAMLVFSFGSFTWGRVEGRRLDARIKGSEARLAELRAFEESHRSEAEVIRLRRFKREMLLSLIGPD